MEFLMTDVRHQRGPAWQARLLFVLLFCLGTGAIAGGDQARETHEIGIGSNRYLLVKHATTNGSRSLLLGLRNSSAHTNATRPDIELLSLQNTDAGSVDADVWMSTNRQSLCLLLGRMVGGNTPDYNLFMYKVAPQSLGIHRYGGQVAKTVEIVDGKRVERERPTPLSVKRVLDTQLDPRNPLRNTTFPLVRVRTISDVRLQETPQGACEVLGVLNYRFAFRLRLAIQEKDETVSAGEVTLEPLPQDQPKK